MKSITTPIPVWNWCVILMTVIKVSQMGQNCKAQEQEACATICTRLEMVDRMTIAIEAAKGLPVTNRFNVNTTELTYAERSHNNEALKKA